MQCFMYQILLQHVQMTDLGLTVYIPTNGVPTTTDAILSMGSAHMVVTVVHMDPSAGVVRRFFFSS